ncbi:hypothetical protein EV641_10481 [Rhodococcus sp. SMB37]|uniref:hypothetical protein n=1 Tax=Rhodococcus sp. SMB37 TaxID=2512213 RepID=UPI0006D25E5B|nr:hypothetical protein [Rhodococcus sp. SMB37]TCN54818.1 hypothetical protein EV641_10481 [Rhodococcus sp. SMB37]
MNDDASSVPSGELPKGGTTETSATEAGQSRSGGRSKAPKRSGTFVYPLPSTPLPSSTPMTVLTAGDTPGVHAIDRNPAGGVGAGTTNEGTSSVTSSTSTNGSTTSTNGSSTDASGTLGTASKSGAPARRNSMGVASVRIAARLAHGELGSRSSHGIDPTIDTDELLQLLGEYLVAGGLEKPEIHATLGGQPIVVDLQSPHRFIR